MGANHPYAHAMHYFASTSISSLSSSGLSYPHRGEWYQNRFVPRYVWHNRFDGWYAFEDLRKAQPELAFLEIQKKAYAGHSARELARARDWFYDFARKRSLHPIGLFLRMPKGRVRYAEELLMPDYQLCHAGVPPGAELVHNFQAYKLADEVGAVQRVFDTADISRATVYRSWCHSHWALPLVVFMMMKKIDEQWSHRPKITRRVYSYIVALDMWPKTWLLGRGRHEGDLLQGSVILL